MKGWDVGTCMRLSIARSLATAMVSPSGSNDACATHDAIMAPRAPPRSAVTTYRPPLTRARAFAMSPVMDSLDFAILSCNTEVQEQIGVKVAGTAGGLCKAREAK
jgi:hypothetical protein